ncbi:MAG: LysR family transcriptional regulator [Pseudomonadota bacterium]|nr:LysR family transcriptional regulator [Pseudomonadota bacterium]
MKELEAMQILLQVAEQKSFSAAADALNIPRSTVSAAVQQLEAELGVRLLQRTTRRVQVTAEGELFMQRARHVLNEVEELRHLFRERQADLRGVIRADMPVPLACGLVLPALPGFVQRYPGLRVELSSTDRRVDPLHEGFDLVVRVGELSDSTLIARPLGQQVMVNCVSPAYISQYGLPQTPDELQQHWLIGYSQTLGRAAQCFEYTDAQGLVQTVTMPVQVTVNNTGAYTAACLAGLGIIQSPRRGVKDYLQRGQLVEVLPQWRCPAMPVSILYPERHFQPQRVRVFIDWLAGLIQASLQD